MLPMDEASLRLLLRVTARISFAFCLGAFISGALQTLKPGKLAAWLVRNCDRFLMVLGVSHLVHLGGVISLAVTIGWPAFVKEITFPVVIGGNIIFLLTYAVALGALARQMRWNWSLARSPRFESFALYAIMVDFTGGFVTRIPDSMLYVIPSGIAIAALALRIAAHIRRAKTASATA
jgi:sulfoxide reductase heme-binding subunit YedZ